MAIIGWTFELPFERGAFVTDDLLDLDDQFGRARAAVVEVVGVESCRA